MVMWVEHLRGHLDGLAVHQLEGEAVAFSAGLSAQADVGIRVVVVVYKIFCVATESILFAGEKEVS